MSKKNRKGKATSSAAKKATNKRITVDYLKGRAEGLVAAGYPKSKWIYFCEELLRLKIGLAPLGRLM